MWSRTTRWHTAGGDMTRLGRRTGAMVVIPFAVGALSLTGVAGGAATAHLTSDSGPTGESSANAGESAAQGGLLDSSRPASREVSATAVPTTSTSVAPPPEVDDEDDDSDRESRTESARAEPQSAAPAPAIPPRPASASPPVQQFAPPVPAPAPAPAPAPPPPPAPPRIDMNLAPVNPQQQIQPGQLHFG